MSGDGDFWIAAASISPVIGLGHAVNVGLFLRSLSTQTTDTLDRYDRLISALLRPNVPPAWRPTPSRRLTHKRVQFADSVDSTRAAVRDSRLRLERAGRWVLVAEVLSALGVLACVVTMVLALEALRGSWSAPALLGEILLAASFAALLIPGSVLTWFSRMARKGAIEEMMMRATFEE